MNAEVAKAVQRGEIPLWNEHTFCGGRPFYSMLESNIFHPLVFPLLMACDPENLSSVYFWLLQLPRSANILWAALGCFVFARFAIRISPLAAVVSGLIFATGPSIAISSRVGSIGMTAIHSWLPWILLCGAGYLRTGRIRWLAGGSISYALLLCTTALQQATRASLFLGATLLAFACASGMFDIRDMGKNIFALKRLAALGAMFALGTAMGALPVTCLMDGIAHQGATGLFGYEQAVKPIDGSLSPVMLAALFIPTFFGMPEGTHAWGEAMFQDLFSNLSGGVVTIFMAACAVAFLWYARKDRREAWNHVRQWTIVAAVLFILGLLVIMGRYTPVYKALCHLLPWFFIYPIPLYYHFIQCWSVAILAGIGIFAIENSAGFASARRRVLFLLVYTVVMLLAAGNALFSPLSQNGKAEPAWTMISRTCEWGWFLREPVLYAGLGLCILLATLSLRSARMQSHILAILVCAEALTLGYLCLYRASYVPRPQDLYDSNMHKSIFMCESYRTPDDFSYCRMAAKLRPLLHDQDVRMVGSIGTMDNLAFIMDARAILGHDTKIVRSEITGALKEFTAGLNDAHEAALTKILKPFMRNMNVGYWIAYKAAITSGPIALAEGPLVAIPLPETPMPSLYTQSRAIVAPEKEQRRQLLYGDLRKNVFVTQPQDAAGMLNEKMSANLLPDDDASAVFTAEQQKNKILRRDERYANKRTVEVDFTEPAMLVRPECWHPGWSVKIDGKPSKVLKVNYLMQGVWVPAGRHTLEFRFMPTAVKIGLLTVCAGIIALVACSVIARRRGAW